MKNSQYVSRTDIELNKWEYNLLPRPRLAVNCYHLAIRVLWHVYLLLLGLMLRETDSFWKECCSCPVKAGSTWHGSAWPGTWLAAGCLLPGALSLECCCCCGEWQLEKILGWNQWCWGNSAVIDAFNCAAGETEWYSLAGNVWTVFTHWEKRVTN